MKSYPVGELTVQVKAIVEWSNKEKFKYAKDTSDTWVLFILERGSFRFGIGKHNGIAGPGDLVLCPPNTELQREILNPLTFLAVYFDWYTGEGEPILDERQLFPNPTGRSVVLDSQRLASTYQYLRKAKDRTDSLSRYRVNFLLQDIWQLYAWERDASKRERYMRPADPLMREVERLLTDNDSGFTNFKNLSRELGLSAVQFTRRFKAAYGMTPTAYLTEARLLKARRLLVETQLTLEEIAQRCGYESGLYLSRVFTKKMRMSPSQYRKAHRL